MWIVKLLSSSLIGSFWSRALLLVLLCTGAGYALMSLGASRERSKWVQQVATAEAQVKKQTEEANERTKTITAEYAAKVAAIRRKYPDAIPSNIVRVYDDCPRSEDAPVEARPVVSDAVPVVTQTQWELENERRFEEQRVQLESLITWVNTLYRNWSSR